MPVGAYAGFDGNPVSDGFPCDMFHQPRIRAKSRRVSIHMLRFAGKKEKDGMTRYMYRTDMSVIDLFKSLRDASSRSMLFIRDAKYSLPNPEYGEWVATSSDSMSDAGPVPKKSINYSCQLGNVEGMAENPQYSSWTFLVEFCTVPMYVRIVSDKGVVAIIVKSQGDDADTVNQLVNAIEETRMIPESTSQRDDIGMGGNEHGASNDPFAGDVIEPVHASHMSPNAPQPQGIPQQGRRFAPQPAPAAPQPPRQPEPKPDKPRVALKRFLAVLLLVPLVTITALGVMNGTAPASIALLDVPGIFLAILGLVVLAKCGKAMRLYKDGDSDCSDAAKSARSWLIVAYVLLVLVVLGVVGLSSLGVSVSL